MCAFDETWAMYGKSFSERNALSILPILVRQAKVGVTLYYSDIAREVDIPFVLNVINPLYLIAEDLQRLGKLWEEDIPPLQCLVVSIVDGLPGDGYGTSIGDRGGYENKSKEEKRTLLKRELGRVEDYRRWGDVLSFFGLKEATVHPGQNDPVNDGDMPLGGTGGGEGQLHRPDMAENTKF